MSIWYVYMLRCRDHSLYTGITTDLGRRVWEHLYSARGAKYLRGKSPLKLVWSMQAADHQEAAHLEFWIKNMPKKDKEYLVATGEGLLPREGEGRAKK